jgi:GH25 family lysozyme M1 (1,4-beta-N-acetylmuramidase)
MSDWIVGIDTHRYNGLMNYRTSYQAGARFVSARCGGGYTNTGQPFTDNQWNSNSVNAPPVFPWFGAWWYMAGYAATIVAQANWCADLLLLHKPKLKLGFWLDCEHWPLGMAQSANRDMVLRFIDTFETRAQMPVRGIYTGQAFWDAYVAPHSRWATLDLWPARYNSTLTGPWSDGRYKFRDWCEWRFWQFSADGNGLGQEFGAPPPPDADYDIDLDRWYSSLDSLYVYAGLQAAPLTYEQKVDRLWDYHPELYG